MENINTMATKIKLTSTQRDLFEIGTVVEIPTAYPERKYLYFPYWIEENMKTGETFLLSWDHLPEELKQYINAKRDG